MRHFLSFLCVIFATAATACVQRADNHFNRGVESSEKGEDDKDIDDFSEAIRLDRNDAGQGEVTRLRLSEPERKSIGVKFTQIQLQPFEQTIQWKNRIVLPTGAVVQDGAESYVFLRNGVSLERVTVRVEFRDEDRTVIANDGAVIPGHSVVVSGAHQIYLAMKNASPEVDPHAGHSHDPATAPNSGTFHVPAANQPP